MPKAGTWVALAGTALLANAYANAQAASIPAPPQCLTEAAQFHQVNVWVLRAIIWRESRNQSDLISRNTDGSIDVGQAGINSVHFGELAKYGIAPANLLNPCVATYVAAWHLARKMKRYGNTWAAVGSYNSETPEKRQIYLENIKAILRQWQVIQ